MNAALYIRVSTEDQTELSPDSQRKLLLDYAKKNDMLVEAEHIFMDEGISGRTAEKRPEFMSMIALAKSKDKPFEKILVWKFSRFARNQEESIVYKNMLKKDGIEVISISEPVIEGPFGSLIERIIEWMDEYYSVRLSSEVHRGMSEKARRGGVQSTKPLGYDIVENEYVINKDESKIIQMIFNKFLGGERYSEIAKHLNTCGFKNKNGNRFEGRGIKYILENPTYCGMIRWNYTSKKTTGRIKDKNEWIISEGNHQAIISKDSFHEAQEIIQSNVSKFADRRPATSHYKHWLGGLLRCSCCGGTLTYSAYAKRPNSKATEFHGYFICNKYKKGSCATKTIITIKQAQEALMAVLETDLELIQRKEYSSLNISYHADTSAEKELLEKQLAKIPEKLKKAKDLYIKGIDTLEEFSVTKTDILKEKEDIEKRLHSLGSNKLDDKKMITTIQTAIKLMSENSNKIVINDFLKTFISQIIINKEAKTFDVQYIAIV